MTSTSVTVSEENVQDVLTEVQQAFFDIPFENSAFQTENFVIASQITPERAYRAIGLRMHNRIQALLEAKYGRAKEDIDIEELQEKIANPETNRFDRRRAELEVEYKLANRKYTDKLINDAICELNILYKHFKALPKFTRAEFEQGELQHFEERLNRQVAGIQGARESLINMQGDFKAITAYEEQVLQLALKETQS